MPHSLLSLPRPVLALGLSAVLVGSLGLTACSAKVPATAKKAQVKASATAGGITKAEVKSPFRTTGIPADLAAVIKPLYYGGAVRSSTSTSHVLNKRKPVKGAGRVAVTGAVSQWKGVPIAVVTTGKDVTLAVKAPKWKVVGGWWPSIGVAAPALGGSPRRVLVIGSDARRGQPVGRSRADSLHIVGQDRHGGGGIVGIARDAYVPLATGGRGKINSALAFGGPKAMQRTVVMGTGVPLDGYLLTGFDGMRKLVNAIGGLKLNIPVAIKDKDAQANIKAGTPRLTGSEALAFARARHTVAGGDFGRSANQGRLIMAAAGFTKLAGPIRLPGILRSASRRIDTNLSAEQVLTFAASVYITNPGKVHNRVAAGGFGMTSDGQSIVLLNARARGLFADIKDGNLS